DNSNNVFYETLNGKYMSRNIEAIFFDMGGTLRRNSPRNEVEKLSISKKIITILNSSISVEELTKLLTYRQQAYEEWASNNLLELDEIRLWTEWMLPEFPVELISRNAMELNEIWRDAICTRKMFPETHEIIPGLYRNGYRLGLVSNTTSSVDSHRMLQNEGLASYFDVIILSCNIGKRKPGPEILLEAVEKMELLPCNCAYVGDRPDWDVVAARGAGFGTTIILRNPNKSLPNYLSPNQTPDHVIDNLKELLELFPIR
ncbi:MAG TPA: HAD family hydrolase, partial [Anaerovoracaceae bacterium]|nr:HAD family hydrolase [Anaerovoracaceae bacterium]